MWAFPSGKVEVGETFLDAPVRELFEETGLRPAGGVAFLDSFAFGRSVGVAFGVRVGSRTVRMEWDAPYLWVERLADIQELPRVSGIDNHFVTLMGIGDSDARWADIAAANCRAENYLN